MRCRSRPTDPAALLTLDQLVIDARERLVEPHERRARLRRFEFERGALRLVAFGDTANECVEPGRAKVLVVAVRRADLLAQIAPERPRIQIALAIPEVTQRREDVLGDGAIRRRADEQNIVGVVVDERPAVVRASDDGSEQFNQSSRLRLPTPATRESPTGSSRWSFAYSTSDSSSLYFAIIFCAPAANVAASASLPSSFALAALSSNLRTRSTSLSRSVIVASGTNSRCFAGTFFAIATIVELDVDSPGALVDGDDASERTSGGACEKLHAGVECEFRHGCNLQ
jgi:hypothetical protein